MRTLGANARRFFTGLAEGCLSAKPRKPRPARPAPAPTADLVWREAVAAEDAPRIRALATATGMFSSAEIDIAGELVEERVARGRASGYEFVIAERGGEIMGYACYGPTPGTRGTFDLYWIAVAPSAQREGLGREILARVESAVQAAGGERLVAETSSTERYAPSTAAAASARWPRSPTSTARATERRSTSSPCPNLPDTGLPRFAKGAAIPPRLASPLTPASFRRAAGAHFERAA